jgi:hypothetical protein
MQVSTQTCRGFELDINGRLFTSQWLRYLEIGRVNAFWPSSSSSSDDDEKKKHQQKEQVAFAPDVTDATRIVTVTPRVLDILPCFEDGCRIVVKAEWFHVLQPGALQRNARVRLASQIVRAGTSSFSSVTTMQCLRSGRIVGVGGATVVRGGAFKVALPEVTRCAILNTRAYLAQRGALMDAVRMPFERAFSTTCNDDVFKWRFTVPSHMIDAFNHLNHAYYADLFMDAVRASIGDEDAVLCMAPCVAVYCEFKRECLWRDIIQVHVVSSKQMGHHDYECRLFLVSRHGESAANDNSSSSSSSSPLRLMSRGKLRFSEARQTPKIVVSAAAAAPAALKAKL